MDAIKFIEERNRMCQSIKGCRKCPAFDNKMHGFCAVGRHSTMDSADQVALVEEWSAAHPRKTRQSAFLEQYPEARCLEDGTLAICPSLLCSAYRNHIGGCNRSDTRCSDCRRKFWMQET